MKQQRGSVMLEGLIAILIFSVGILALMGMQANSIKNSVEAKYRADASYYVNQMVGRMWVSASSVLPQYHSPSGSQFVAWKAEVAKGLPGVASCAPTIVPAASNVTVTVRWLMPQEPAGTPCHQFVVVTRVGSALN